MEKEKDNLKEKQDVDVDNQVDFIRYKLTYEDKQFDDAIRSYESRWD